MKTKIKYFIVNFLFLIGIVIVILLTSCNNSTKLIDTKELYSEAIKKTVEIRCSSEGTNYGYATGCIISNDGNILTNKHVVMHNGQLFENIEVRLYDAVEYHTANIVKISDTEDLALINVNISMLDSFTIGNSAIGGQNIYTIGNPNGFGLSFSEGVVSSPLRFIDYNGQQIKTIQTSIVINEGNSGGALFNEKCELIGLMSFRLRNSSGEAIQGVSFALHYSTILSFI